MSEALIQKKSIKYAEKLGWYALKVTVCNKNGHPDATFFKNGKSFFIEFKKEGKQKLDPLQVLRKKQLTNLGFPVFTINNFGDAKKIIDEYNSYSIQEYQRIVQSILDQ